MAGIKDYSTTPASNTALFPEGMAPSAVNDGMRQVQADVREWYNDAQWVIYGDGDGSFTVAYASATSFTVNGVNVTSAYHAGRRVKAVGSSTGTIYGTISSSSFATNTTVAVTWDSGSLQNETITVYLAALSKTNDSLPDSVAKLDAAKTFTAAQTFTGGVTANSSLDAQQQVKRSGDISPAQIAADQNDYNPTGLSTASVLRLTSDASRTITGLQGGADGREVTIINIGSNPIVLADDSASSSAANRFALNGNRTLAPDDGVDLWYDSTSSRWRQRDTATGAASDTGAGVIEIAVQSEMETATDNTRAVPPGRVHNHPGVAKAWVVFNGDAGASVLASYNVTSVTRQSEGKYTVTFTTAFSGTEYVVVVGGKSTDATRELLGSIDPGTTPTTSSVQIMTGTAADATVDGLRVHAVFFGDQ